MDGHGQEAQEKYLDSLKRLEQEIYQSSTTNTDYIQEKQYECLKELLDIWYATDNNASTLTVEPVEKGKFDYFGTQKEQKYQLSDGQNGNSGVIGRIVNMDIFPVVEGQMINIGGQNINAGLVLSNIMGLSRNQVYGRNMEKLENYMIQKIDQGVDVGNSDYVSTDEIINTSTMENIEKLLSGIAGVLYYPIKFIVFLIPGGVIQLIIQGIASIGGSSEEWVGLESILFNRVPITNANIFAGGNGIFISNIATWYMGLRNLAIVVQLCMLIYIGIRMGISSIGDKKARYKEMLKNWVMGMLILFLLHYFMIAILNFNDSLISIIGSGGNSYANLISELTDICLEVNIVRSTAAAMCYLMLTGITFGFLMMYIRRMLTISLLTLVGPLVTTTYAMDKVGDKRSQVLDTWVREYAYNVLVQPFHCIIYLVFVRNAIDILAKSPDSFISAIIAVMCIAFIFIAEGIIKAIFGIKGATMTSAASSIAAFTAGVTAAANLRGQVKSAEEKIKSNVKAEGDMAKKMPKLQSNQANQNTGIAQKARGVGEKMASGAGKVVGGLKNVYLNPKLTGIQAAMLTGALGLAQGDAATAVQSARAGNKAGQNIGAHMSERNKQNQIRRNEKMFERAYDEYQLANPGADMIAVTKQILSAKSNSQIPQNMQGYAAFVHGLKDTYNIAGYENPEQAAIDMAKDLKKYQ